MAEEMIDSGKAMKKMREIIAAQGGNPEVKPEDLPVGPESAVVRSNKLAKCFGLALMILCGLHVKLEHLKRKVQALFCMLKLGDTVHKDGVLFEIYAERSSKLASALELAGQLSPIVLSKKPEEKMILDRVPEQATHEKTFMLDR